MLYTNTNAINLYTPHPSLPLKKLCHNEGDAMFVILNEVKNLIESISYKTEILRLTPQNDIVTQSPRG
jgi:hypothetical protein